VSKLYGMLAADVDGDPAARSPAMNQTVRNGFVIGPDIRIVPSRRAERQPPATAGRIVSSSPSLTGVSSPSRKRMSSPPM
jgi:hypothetical protein